ncbi:MAG TPA: glycosyltransferase family 87 protein [Candidatus Binataceae bacterium]|nr:glycosyltransferase family 87 protein [Candidatus Binataceae bacterium]
MKPRVAAGCSGQQIRLLAVLILLAGAACLVKSLHRNRGNYAKVSMFEYYAWSSELRAGGDPWMSARDPAFKPLPGVLHLGHCNYPPAFLIAFEPLTRLPLRTAFWVWQAILVGALCGAAVVMVRELAPPPGLDPYLIGIGAALLFPETYGMLYESQYTPILLLLLVGAFALDRRERSLPAGLMLAAATLLKMFPGLAGGYFFVRRRWPTLVWSVVVTLAGLMLTRARNEHSYVSAGILHSSWLEDDGFLRNSRAIALYYNLRALMDWLAGGPVSGSGLRLWLALTALADLLVVAVTFISTARSHRSDAHDLAAFGLWICAALLVSPIAWGHYLPLLLPLLFALGVLELRGASLGWCARILVLTGLTLISLGFFTSVVRELHAFFLATVAIFIGGNIILRRPYQGEAPGRSARSPSVSRSGLQSAHGTALS